MILINSCGYPFVGGGGGGPDGLSPGLGGCNFFVASLYFSYCDVLNTFFMLSSLSLTSLSISSFTFGSGGGGGGGGLSFRSLSAAAKNVLYACSIAAFCAADGCTSCWITSLVLFILSSILGGLGGCCGSCVLATITNRIKLAD